MPNCAVTDEVFEDPYCRRRVSRDYKRGELGCRSGRSPFRHWFDCCDKTGQPCCLVDEALASRLRQSAPEPGNPGVELVVLPIADTKCHWDDGHHEAACLRLLARQRKATYKILHGLQARIHVLGRSVCFAFA